MKTSANSRPVIRRRPALACSVTPHATEALLRLGAQSYSFRKFDTAGAINNLKALGSAEMEFCGVHFPADAGAPDFAAVKQTLQDAGIRVPVYGVEHFNEDAAASRKKFEFAKALGIGILSAYPEPASFDHLELLVEEFQVKIAIHNHGPESIYSKVEDTLKAVEGRHPFIGACVDTGHCLRSGEAPHEVIAQLGARVHSVHLKDWTIGGEEQIIGEGDMDVVKVAEALLRGRFAGPLMLEYELSPEGPVDDMKKGIHNWRTAVSQLAL